MRRREFIGIIGSVVAAWPIAARGQQPERMRRIGVLLAGTPTSFAPRANAFVQGLRELGYVEGKTVAYEWKWGEDRTERLPQLAEELVRLNVDAILTGGTPAAKALKNATPTVPIVMARGWRIAAGGWRATIADASDRPAQHRVATYG